MEEIGFKFDDQLYANQMSKASYTLDIHAAQLIEREEKQNVRNDGAFIF